MQLLIVDDDPYIRRGLTRALRSAAPRDWTATTAESGEEALGLLAAQGFDVIVSDMRMPGVDGPALLAQVREHYPDTARLVLSGHADLRDAVRVAPVAHQFLDKPIRPSELVAVIDGALRARALVPAGPVRVALGRLGDLPCAPSTHAELVQLAGEPSTTEELVALVASDPALAGAVLKLASTSFFTRGAPMSDVRAAVQRLGAPVVRSTLLARVEAAPPEVGPLFDRVRDRARAAAAAATDADARAAALLRELGVLALAAAFPAQAAAVAAEVDAGLARVEAECAAWRVTHREVGGYLVGLWGLPATLVAAVAGQAPPPIDSSTPRVPCPSAIRP